MPATSINLTGPVIDPISGLQMTPDGGIQRYVYQSSTGAGITSLDQLPTSMADVSDLTVAAALLKCRANRGDSITVLPGHVETIGVAAAWTSVAGVTIACMGNGKDRATFNFTTAASQIVCSAQGFRVINGVFNVAATAATVVTKAFAVTNETIFEGCYFIGGISGTQSFTTGIEFATGSDNSRMDSCYFKSAANAAGNPITIVNAVDSISIRRTIIIAGTSAVGQGVVQASAATTNWVMDDCNFVNTITNSTAAVVGFAGITGMFSYLNCGITAASGGATAIATPGSINMVQCFGGVQGKSAIAITPTST